MTTSAFESGWQGAAQGATLGWGDELVSEILASLPGPEDQTGIPREYAAGSAQQDYLNTERGANADAAQSHPLAYGAGQLAGAAPAAIASSGAAGSSIAAQTAMGAALGASQGAGSATEGNRLLGAAEGGAAGALTAGALSAGGKAVQAARVRALPPGTQLGLPNVGEPELPAVRQPAVSVAPSAKPVPTGQTQLPLEGAEYYYHNTPAENVPEISKSGLQPREGGKNFDLKKNKGRLYFTQADQADMWAKHVADETGKPIVQLRTTKPVSSVPGANKSVLIRTEHVPPERIEMKMPSGQWVPIQSALRLAGE